MQVCGRAHHSAMQLGVKQHPKRQSRGYCRSLGGLEVGPTPTAARTSKKRFEPLWGGLSSPPNPTSWRAASDPAARAEVGCWRAAGEGREWVGRARGGWDGRKRQDSKVARKAGDGRTPSPLQSNASHLRKRIFKTLRLCQQSCQASKA